MSKLLQIDGLPVRDALAPITLTVARRDISHASKKRPESCAVARACRRQFDIDDVRVHLGRTYLRRAGADHYERYITPADMRSEIIAFDRGGAFAPSVFRLSAPQPAKRLGKRRGGKDARRPTGQKRRKYHRVTEVRGGPA